MQRNGGEEIPGCRGVDVGPSDYCIDPGYLTMTLSDSTPSEMKSPTASWTFRPTIGPDPDIEPHQDDDDFFDDDDRHFEAPN